MAVLPPRATREAEIVSLQIADDVLGTDMPNTNLPYVHACLFSTLRCVIHDHGERCYDVIRCCDVISLSLDTMKMKRKVRVMSSSSIEARKEGGNNGKLVLAGNREEVTDRRYDIMVSLVKSITLPYLARAR